MTIILRPQEMYEGVAKNLSHVFSPGASYHATLTYHFPKSDSHYVDKDRRAYRSSLISGYPRQTPYSAKHYKMGTLSLGQTLTQRNSDGRLTSVTGLFGLSELGFVADVTDSSVQNLANAAMNSSRSKLNGLVRNQYYSTFETVYEGRKTKEMVAKAATTIYQAFTDVRRGNFLRAAKRLGLSETPKGVKGGRKAGNNWLEYRYGWTPLYSTVFGEMKRKFDHMRNKEPVLVRSAVSDTYYTTKVDFGTPSTNGELEFVGLSFRGKRTVKYSISCRSVAAYKVVNTGLANYTEIGLTNPALVAWELVPLSFVADWFVNVSDVLEQMDAWAGKTIISYSDTVRIAATIDNISLFTPITGNDILIDVPARYQSSFVYVNRTLRSNPPTIAIGFQPQFTNKRVLDAVALLSQAFRK